jgi:excisionase family DNA binding protein
MIVADTPMASTAPVTRMLSSREVAENLGVSIDAVRRAIRSGALAAYKPCGRIRIREEDLVAYLDGQRISGVRRAAEPRPSPRVSRPIAHNLPTL